MPGSLTFSAGGDRRTIRVARDDAVSNAFWRTLRAEWGQSGPEPNRVVDVPLALFLSRHDWLPGVCRKHSVSVLLDETTRAHLRRIRQDRDAQQQVRAATDGASANVAAELRASRYCRELRDFQTRDLRRMLALRHAANFSVPGAGKTAVALAVYEVEKHRGRVSQLLVVGPLSAFDAWRQEAMECMVPGPNVHSFDGAEIPGSAEIILASYQRLHLSFAALSDWAQRAPTHVVLDEAHRMKRGRDGEWGTACLDLAYFAERRDILTGTPAPNHPRDLGPLLDFMWPGRSHRILPRASFLPHPSPTEVASITPAIAPYFVRTTKNELGLPATTKRVVRVPLSGLHREIYDSLRLQYSSRINSQQDRVQLAAWGEVYMYLLEAATNPALLPAGSSSDDPVEFRHPPLPIPEGSSIRRLIADYATYETPEKFIQLAAMVQDLRARGRKVLIWSNFVRNLLTLSRLLARHEPALIHGGIPVSGGQSGSPTRESELERFNKDDDCGVLLANPAVMAEGVSLHHVCHDAIYLERTFNAGQYLQSVDRIHRLGLQPGQDTNITFLVSEGTIDETVAERIEVKATRLGTVLDDRSIATLALPDEEDVGPPIDVGDAGDIAALFAHLRGD